MFFGNIPSKPMPFIQWQIFNQRLKKDGWTIKCSRPNGEHLILIPMFSHSFFQISERERERVFFKHNIHNDNRVLYCENFKCKFIRKHVSGYKHIDQFFSLLSTERITLSLSKK